MRAPSLFRPDFAHQYSSGNRKQWAEALPVGLAWIAVAAALCALVGAAWLGVRSDQPATANRENLGLRVTHAGNALRLSWNPSPEMVSSSGKGLLSIDDGDSSKRMSLNAQDLARGFLMYVPASDRVAFQLAIAGSSEKVSATMPVSTPGPPVPEAGTPTAEIRESATSKREPAIARKDAERSFTPSSQERSQDASAPEIAAAVPVPVLPETLKAEPPRPLAPPTSRVSEEHTPTPSVRVSFEPAPDSVLRRGLQKVPIVRVLQHFRYKGGENFTPAEPEKELKPSEPGTLARELPGEWRIALDAAIDKDGRVSKVDVLTPETDHRLADLAANTLLKTKFQPAHVGTFKVASHLMFTFDFRNPR